MIAFEEFHNMPADFWAFIKYVSENLGYTERGAGVKVYSIDEIEELCRLNNISAPYEEIQAAV